MAHKKQTPNRAAKLVSRTQARTRRLTGISEAASNPAGFIRKTGVGKSGITVRTLKEIGGTKGKRFSVERKRAATQLRTLRSLGKIALARKQQAKAGTSTVKQRVKALTGISAKAQATKGPRFARQRRQAAQVVKQARSFARSGGSSKPIMAKVVKRPPTRVTIRGPGAAKRAKTIALKRARKGLGTKITRKPKTTPPPFKPPTKPKTAKSTLSGPSKSLAFRRLIQRRKR